jgi:hypothetical protein
MHWFECWSRPGGAWRAAAGANLHQLQTAMKSPQSRSVPKPALRASLCAMAFFLATTAASAFQWSDTFIGYRWGTDYREPVNSRKIAKNIVQFQHVNGYAYGSNFLNIDALLSNGDDPANGGGGGATEFYCVFRSTLSYEKVFKKDLQWKFIRDIGLTGGFDLNTKNDEFASKVQELYVGPTIELDVPGFLNVSFLLSKENNHNGFVGKDVYSDPTYCISLSWGIPIGKAFVFKGFANFIGSKGKDGFGAETAPETLIEAALMVDPFFKKESLKGRLFVGVGYQYWNNKFGNDNSHDPTGGSKASLPQLQIEFHF